MKNRPTNGNSVKLHFFAERDHQRSTNQLMKITHQLGFEQTVDETYSQCDNPIARSCGHRLPLQLVVAESCAIMSLLWPTSTASSMTLALTGTIQPFCSLLFGVGRRKVAGSSSPFRDHNEGLLVIIGVFTEEVELDLDLPPPFGVHNLPLARGLGLSRAFDDSLGGVVGGSQECWGLFGIEGLD